MDAEEDSTESVLLRVGWYPGRAVPEKVAYWKEQLPAFVMFDAAREALREFGGLSVEVSGPGIDHARTSFDIDPMLAIGEDDRFGSFEHAVGERLFPLGEAMRGNAFLAIGESGRVFLIGDEIAFVGRTMTEAIDSLIQGKSAK